ncbi:MAG: mechanosensitive ion channel family protein [Candidatus Omnitrophica bacterium]|nr:mechanosensitive ion channel family protein [Candidatus Omnitrophota bacterium]
MFEEILAKSFFSNTVFKYLMAVLIFVIAFIFLKIFEKVLLKKLKKWSEKTVTSVDDFLVDIIQKIFVPISYFCALYLAINTLTLDTFIRNGIKIVAMALITLFAAYFASIFVTYAFKVYWRKRGKNVAIESSLKGILNIAKVFVWGGAIIFFLDNVGFKVSTVIAGLGIGGVAVALAAQVLLKDLFSYFSIIFDRPFEIGDFIIVGDYLGVVEHVGIKTTRIRSLGGEQLIFSNTDLTDSRVRNYKRMQQRRVVFSFGVTYQATASQLKEIPEVVKTIISNVDNTKFDRAHFASYGDSSLNFEVVYYVLTGDYNKYMDVQQEINLAIKSELEDRGVEFAYPTQTVYLNKT